jgi:hypothetical protein
MKLPPWAGQAALILVATGAAAGWLRSRERAAVERDRAARWIDSVTVAYHADSVMTAVRDSAARDSIAALERRLAATRSVARAANARADTILGHLRAHLTGPLAASLDSVIAEKDSAIRSLGRALAIADSTIAAERGRAAFWEARTHGLESETRLLLAKTEEYRRRADPSLLKRVVRDLPVYLTTAAVAYAVGSR